MPIEFKCPCGKSLIAKEEAAGKRVKCPACQQVLAVPSPPQAARPPAADLRLAAESPERAAQTCPHCGHAVAPDAATCPNCQFDLHTGSVPGPFPESPEARPGPLSGLPIGKIAAAVVGLACLAGVWFVFIKPMLDTIRTNDAYNSYVRTGELEQAVGKLEELSRRVGGQDRQRVALWIAQIKAELEKNPGDTSDVLSDAVDMTVHTVGDAGCMLKTQVTNKGPTPLTLKLEYFYLRGTKLIEPVAAEQGANSLGGVVVPPGQSVTGTVVFRQHPRDLIGGAFCAMCFNDGSRYVRRAFQP